MRITAAKCKMKSQNISLCLCLTLLLVLCLLIQESLALDCYTDVDMTKEEDCQMHTGCVKKFNVKTKETIQRGCFLTNGVQDRCGVDSEGVGFCYCHSTLCNGANINQMATMLLVILAGSLAYASQYYLK